MAAYFDLTMRRVHWESLVCGLRGHALLGTDVAAVRPEDDVVLREPGDGLRWHRCVRCDAWLPRQPPVGPVHEFLPDPADVELPLRGRPLRDRIVLRLIALDRLVHFLVLGTLSVAVFAFVEERAVLSAPFFRVLDAVQGGIAGPNGLAGAGIVHELRLAFAASPRTLELIGAVLAGYALLEGAEAVGLWFGKRWAEYLTFVATSLLLVPEIYELTGRVTVTKVLALLVNLAVVAYLLYAKRLFGVRGGGKVEEEQRRRDTGWSALVRTAPMSSGAVRRARPPAGTADG